MTSIFYSDTGVSIDAAHTAKEKIKALAATTFNPRVLTEIGSFGGMFDAVFPEVKSPVLVASSDGVGTKLKLAFLTGQHSRVGCDLVNHCVNDILVQGARPLFFLDYIAMGKLAPATVETLVAGMALGCRENDCALLGGETAEMPGFYQADEYDIAGFIVGVVSRDKIIDGRKITPGDKIFGVASAGLHTNGYSLARKLFFDTASYELNTYVDELQMTVAEALLQPHVSYFKPLKDLIDIQVVKGMAHITGGGLRENIPRILPAGAAVRIEQGSWPVLPVFKLMQQIGNIPDAEMYRTFNMGLGMVIICGADDASKVQSHLQADNTNCYAIGEVIRGDGDVIIN